jgi:hypothetical protein
MAMGRSSPNLANRSLWTGRSAAWRDWIQEMTPMLMMYRSGPIVDFVQDPDVARV